MTDYIITPETIEIEMAVVSPEVRNVETLLKAIAGQDLADCEFLWYIHPEIYRESRLLQEYSPFASDRYRFFLRSIDDALCEIRKLLEELLTWLDPYEAPYPILPFLSPIVGIDFNFDLPEEMARREVANAIFLWERKGTRDNIGDWIGFITGFRVKIREYYKEVLRTNVWGQAYAESPSTILNKGGANYATLPHLDEHHATNTWAGNAALLPFYNFSVAPDTNYGVHGFTQLDETDRNGEILPGYLFRNHVGVYLDIPEENLDLAWFGQPYYYVIINKIERIFDLICFYGVVKHLFWTIISEENSDYCAEDSVTGEIINCDNVGESCILCLGETYCIDIEDLLCGTGRLATILMCTNDPQRITNADGGSPFGGPWLTYFNLRYWTIQSEDTLQTWIPDTNGVLDSEVDVLEAVAGEQFIDPYIGQFDSVFGPGQGREFSCDISDWVTDLCENGAFEDLIFFEDWETPFQDNVVLADDWEIQEVFQENVVFADNWEIAETFQDNAVFTDDWNFSVTFQDNFVYFDDWEDYPPAAIAGLSMWLDAGFGVTTNSPVSFWLDRSYSGNDAYQNDVGSRPQLINSESAFNNLPVINFDSPLRHMIVDDDASLNTDKFTCFVVGRWTNPSDFATFIAKVADQPWAQGWGIGQTPDSSGENLTFFVDDYTSNFVEYQLFSGQPVVICVQYDQSELTLHINGFLVGTDLYGAGVTNTSGPLIVGGHTRPGFPNNVDGELDGDIAEIIYYNDAISAVDKSNVVNYLLVKYGLVSGLTPVLLNTETWEPPTHAINLVHFEDWDVEVITLLVDEDWEPPAESSAGPMLLVDEDWEPIGPNNVVEGIELWLDADNLGAQTETVWFEDWELSYGQTPTLLVDENWEPIGPCGLAESIALWLDANELGEQTETVWSEDWEIIPVSDTGTLQYTEGWEVTSVISNPGILQYTEGWEYFTISNPGTSQYTETWDFDSGSPSLAWSETWEFGLPSTPISQWSEDWEVTLPDTVDSASSWQETWEISIPSSINIEWTEDWE